MMAATPLQQLQIQTTPIQVHHRRNLAPLSLPIRNLSVSAIPTTFSSGLGLKLKNPKTVTLTLKLNPRILSCQACSKPAQVTSRSNKILALAVLSGAIVVAIRTVAEKFLQTVIANPNFRPPLGVASLISSSSPLFFAAASSSARVATPYDVIASGMAKWLQLYSGVLMIRVMLSWFPNIQWERQPMCAIRDLSDPYLNLFRNILPPVMGILDISPMLAFFVLGFFQVVLGHN